MVRGLGGKEPGLLTTHKSSVESTILAHTADRGLVSDAITHTSNRGSQGESVRYVWSWRKGTRVNTKTVV